ncbi:MAG: DNA-binding protein/DNA complex [Podoviridae sp. ctLUJ1]|nr:MAG: DNA-binding protein/DNA complex [Podoviridae sp. ctLUJ1]
MNLQVKTILDLVFLKYDEKQIRIIQLPRGNWTIRKNTIFDPAKWVTQVEGLSTNAGLNLVNSMLMNPAFGNVVSDTLDGMLIKAYGNQTKVARITGMTRNTLTRFIQLKTPTSPVVRIKDSIYVYKGVATDLN